MEEALEMITDFADSMDTANGMRYIFYWLNKTLTLVLLVSPDFHKIGGFFILIPCLNSPHDGVRWRCCQLIGTLTQNNPYCQQHVLNEDLLPILLKMLENDDCEESRIKALYAISCNEQIYNSH
jgi:hsp70-interacting protein